MTLLSCRSILLQVLFGADRDGFREPGPLWREGGRDQILPLRASKSSRSWGGKEHEVTEFWRGRFCSRREEEHLCPAQLQHLLGLLGSCGRPELFIFNQSVHAWLTAHLGKLWSCPWLTALALGMGIFHLGQREMGWVGTPSHSPGEASGPQGCP